MAAAAAASTAPPTLDDLPVEQRIVRLVVFHDGAIKERATLNTIAKFGGKEKALLASLVKKYADKGGEPPLTETEIKNINAKRAAAAAAAAAAAPPVAAAAPAAAGGGAGAAPLATAVPAGAGGAPPAAAAPAASSAPAAVPVSPTAAAEAAKKKQQEEEEAAAAKAKKEAEDKAEAERKREADEKAEAERIKAARIVTLDDMPFEERIRRHVMHYEPEKIATVTPSLAEYKGKEKALLDSLVSKHGVEQPLTPDEIERIKNPPPPPSSDIATPGGADGDKPKNDGDDDGDAAAAAPKTPVPNPFQDAFDIQPRPPSPRQPTVLERIQRMMAHYDPKSAATVESSYKKDPAKGEQLLRSLCEAYGPEPDYSTTIVPWDEDSLLLADIPPEEEPKSFGEVYARIMRIVELKDPASIQYLPITLEAFRGKEKTLLRALIQKYHGEPPANTDVSIADSDDVAARMGIGGRGGDDSDSRASSVSGMSTGGGGGGALKGLRGGQPQWVLNEPPPPANYSGFARMSVGRLNQKSNREPILPNPAAAMLPPTVPGANPAVGAAGAGAGASPVAVGAAAAAMGSAATTPPPAVPPFVMPSPPADIAPPEVDALVFARPERNADTDAKISARFKGWGRAIDKPICERLYYAPNPERLRAQQQQQQQQAAAAAVAAARNAFTANRAASPPAAGADGSAAASAGPATAAVETEQERKTRLAAAIKARPLPPPARLLKSDLGMFGTPLPFAKMDDVDKEYGTMKVLGEIRERMKQTEAMEAQVRALIVKEQADWYDDYEARREKDKRRALLRLEQRMAGHIESISARYAFRPQTTTYSPEEEEDEEGVLVHRLLDSDEDGDFEAEKRVARSLRPLEGEEAVGLMLSDRENFLLAVLPEGALRSRRKRAVIADALRRGCSMEEAIAAAGKATTNSNNNDDGGNGGGRSGSPYVVGSRSNKENDKGELRSPPSWQFRARLARFVRKYIPAAIDDVSRVAADHVGKEETLMAFLRAKYGPEPGTLSDDAMAGIQNGDALLPHSAELAEQSHIFIAQPVTRSLADLDDYVFAPGDRPPPRPGVPPGAYDVEFRRSNDPDFTYRGVPPPAPPSLDDELRELRRSYYKEPWGPLEVAAYDDVMERAEERKGARSGLNSFYDDRKKQAAAAKNAPATAGDARLLEVDALLQAVEVSTNALMAQDPRWMAEENVPRQFWDIVEHRDADEDDAVLGGGGRAELAERLNEAAKLGVPQEEFMRIERERAEKRRKERERNARELRDAKQRVLELEQAQVAAQEEAKKAKQELELARIEAEEKIAAANRRVEETRSQTLREMRQLDERSKAAEDDAARRERERAATLAMQRALEEERLKDKESTLAAREREVQMRLEEAQRREQERKAAEEERRQREREEVEKWKAKALEKETPRRTDGVQTDPVTDLAGLSPSAHNARLQRMLMMHGEVETQAEGSPVGESSTQTRQDLVIIDDPKELKEIFEIKRQTDAGVPLLDAIRQSSWENGARSAAAATGSGSNSPFRSPGGRVQMADTGSQSNATAVDTVTRDVQTPDFVSVQVRGRLKMADLEYEEQVMRSKLAMQALESSPRLLARSRESVRPSATSLLATQQAQQQLAQAQAQAQAQSQALAAQQQQLAAQQQQLAAQQQQQQQQLAAQQQLQKQQPQVAPVAAVGLQQVPSDTNAAAAAAAASAAQQQPPQQAGNAAAAGNGGSQLSPPPSRPNPAATTIAAVAAPQQQPQTQQQQFPPGQRAESTDSSLLPQASPDPTRPGAVSQQQQPQPQPQPQQQQPPARLVAGVADVPASAQQQPPRSPNAVPPTSFAAAGGGGGGGLHQVVIPGVQARHQDAFPSHAGYTAPESATFEEYQDRVRIMYKKYAPDKGVGGVDAILNRYHGAERTLLTALALKYGPEPEAVEAGILLQAVRADQREYQVQQAQQQKLRLQQQHQQQAAGASASPAAYAQHGNAATPYNPAAPGRSNAHQASGQRLGGAAAPSDLYLEPIEFQHFFQHWEIAPVLLPATSSNATPRLAACKLTPEDVFLFPSLEANAARRSVKRQVQSLVQMQQQVLQMAHPAAGAPLPEVRPPYNDAALNALQDAAARCFYFSQVMYWCPPRNPSWKYVAVTGREILVGDDENHLKHRLCLLGSPSEAVALSVILYQGLGNEGDDAPCVVIIRRGTPPVTRAWTADVDPNPNIPTQSLHTFPGMTTAASSSSSSSSGQGRNGGGGGGASSSSDSQQDVVLFFPSGLQARKNNEVPAAGGASRLPVQGRFASLRAQRLVSAIEFAVQSEGPVAASASGGSLVSAPVSCWNLRCPPLQPPPGVDETSFLLERAARDLCSLRYSARSGSGGGGATPLPPGVAGVATPSQSVPDSAVGARSFVDPGASPLVQAHPSQQLTLMDLARRQGAGFGPLQQKQQQQQQYNQAQQGYAADGDTGPMAQLMRTLDQRQEERRHPQPVMPMRLPPGGDVTPQAQVMYRDPQQQQQQAQPTQYHGLTAEALAAAARQQNATAPQQGQPYQQQQQQQQALSPAQQTLALLRARQAAARGGGVADTPQARMRWIQDSVRQ